jgi:hypothetical protein
MLLTPQIPLLELAQSQTLVTGELQQLEPSILAKT